MPSDAQLPAKPNNSIPTDGQEPGTVEYNPALLQNSRVKSLSVTVGLDDAQDGHPPQVSNAVQKTTDSTEVPAHIGRYRVISTLGRGGFGTVYLAHDDLSDRPVAIKVPRRDRLDSQRAVETFLSEARHVSRLKHSAIVTLYDCGQVNGQCYLVYEFIEGTTLSQRTKRGPIGHREAALLVADIAEALHHAHGENVFHRDIKPGNILLDKHGRPHVTDFGLAVRENELAGERGRRSGTCPYISPEQVRGEGHRIDGRTDIYSLGAVLYELLCGRAPFDRHSGDVLEQIVQRDPRPPRQIDDSVSRELERICLKALSKQISSRYPTAQDMADELRAAVEPPATAPPSDVAIVATPRPEQPLRVVPKGLRSFGPEDSEFFLELLPGPRDREGLPDSIRFWKTRIESRNSDATFSVGLIYGPSGCGKSSLMKAGLLPRLAKSVSSVYVEATREETEARLRKNLRKTCPELEAGMSLTEMFTRLRRGDLLAGSQKVLIVIDQFEQWLHVHGQHMQSTDMLSALRHADGEHVQVLLLVRDDFWMGITRLFDSLEIHLDPQRNTRVVDLFDLQHAQGVLLLLGQAYNRLPSVEADLTSDQINFLDQAVHELSQDGRVISMRLSLFAELMKERPWNLASLVEVGGTAGIGVRFLEETFTARSAVPEYRSFEKQARSLLHALLPEPGTDIKGHIRSRSELASACALHEDSPRFARLLQILDHDLHIITPTEPQEDSCPPPSALAPPPSFYQLTHDYLVSPVYQWLTLERRKTWRGRAELCLEERMAQMSQWPQSRYLPPPWEYLSIAFGVPRSKRKNEQQALMREATRFYGVRWGGALAAVLIIGCILQEYVRSIRRDSIAREAASLVEAIVSTSPHGVQSAIKEVRPFRDPAVQLLRDRFWQEEPDSSRQLQAALALADLGEPNGPFLVDAVGKAHTSQCMNLVTALGRLGDSAGGRLVARFREESEPAIRSRYATVLLHLGRPDEAGELLRHEENPIYRMAFLLGFPNWHGDFTGFADLLHAIDNGSFRSGICAALALVDRDALGSHDRRLLLDELVRLYTESRDGGTHSATGCVLKRWLGNMPRIEPADGPEDGRDWFVNRAGMTMLRIDPGQFDMGDPKDPNEPLHHVTLTKRFFMSDREVSLDLFCEFVNDPDCRDEDKPRGWIRPDQNLSPTGDHPVQAVSWFDAILFCNWLSRREGLDPCYERTGEKRPYDSIDMVSKKPIAIECVVWRWRREANGYRLPIEAEWEYACRAGTVTDYSCGDDRRLLFHFAIFENLGATDVRASRLPNGWGLFDMQGNVSEWCWDWAAPYTAAPSTDPAGPATGLAKVARGGDAGAPAAACRSGRRISKTQLALRAALTGFRAVCGDPGAGAR